MAKNIKFRATDTLTLPVPAGVVSGDPIAIGAITGVAETSRDAAGNATVIIKPSHVATVQTTDAVATVGLALYVTAAKAITTTLTSNTLFGYSIATKGAGAGSIDVLMV